MAGRKTSGRGGNVAKDEQTELLRSIWNEMKAVKSSLEFQLEETRRDLGGRIDQTNARLEETRRDLGGRIDQTNARLEETNSRLDSLEQSLVRRITESEMRLATATTELAGDVQGLTAVIRTAYGRDFEEVRGRLDRLERHTGLVNR